MKKLLVAFIVFLFCFKVDAITVNEFKDKLYKEYTINGKVYSVSNDNKVEIDRFLKSNNFTSYELDILSSLVDRVLNLISTNSLTDREIMDIIEEIYNYTGIKVNYVDKNFVIYDKDGNMFTKLSKNQIKYTDGNNYAYYIIISLCLILFIVILRYKHEKVY